MKHETIKTIENIKYKDIKNINIDDLKHIINILVKINNLKKLEQSADDRWWNENIYPLTKEIEKFGYKYWLDIDEWIWY